MAGQEDNRKVDVFIVELSLKVEAALARQPDIEHQTAGAVGPLVCEELACRLEHSDLQPYGLKQIVERGPDRGRVVPTAVVDLAAAG